MDLHILFKYNVKWSRMDTKLSQAKLWFKISMAQEILLQSQ